VQPRPAEEIAAKIYRRDGESADPATQQRGVIVWSVYHLASVPRSSRCRLKDATKLNNSSSRSLSQFEQIPRRSLALFCHEFGRQGKKNDSLHNKPRNTGRATGPLMIKPSMLCNRSNGGVFSIDNDMK